MSAAGEGTWPAEAASVPLARRMVREHLRRNGQGELSDAAELLVSELVGNVVLHVGGSFTVRLSSAPGEALLEVVDGSTVTPLLRAFSGTASTGRGMRLVHSLSAEHGVRLHEAGKVVWVRLTATHAGRSDEELAEGFADVDWLEVVETGDAEPAAPAGAHLHVHRAARSAARARPRAVEALAA